MHHGLINNTVFRTYFVQKIKGTADLNSSKLLIILEAAIGIEPMNRAFAVI